MVRVIDVPGTASFTDTVARRLPDAIADHLRLARFAGQHVLVLQLQPGQALVVVAAHEPKQLRSQRSLGIDPLDLRANADPDDIQRLDLRARRLFDPPGQIPEPRVAAELREQLCLPALRE